MDLMELIELHTTYAPRAGSLEPADPTLEDRQQAARRRSQDALNMALYGEVTQ